MVNDDRMAENLGREYVYCKKVTPSCIAVPRIDENAIINELEPVFRCTKKHLCRTEVLMRDVMTLSGNPHNAIRWVEIAREESDVKVNYIYRFADCFLVVRLLFWPSAVSGVLPLLFFLRAFLLSG